MQSRQEYIDSLHRKIDEWDMEIDRLAAKKEEVEAESRLELQKQIASLKQKRAEINEQLDQTKSAGEGAWRDLKSGLDSAWKVMNSAVDSAVSRFLK